MSIQAIQLLDSLLRMLHETNFRDDDALDRFSKRGNMLLNKIYGEDSNQVGDFNSIYFRPLHMDPTLGDLDKALGIATMQMTNLLETFKEEQGLDDSDLVKVSSATDAQTQSSTTVFIVHGHDEELKQAVARAVEKMGLDPIILHEKPNKGRTIIEKFEDYSEVGFAVVLLSPDDVVRAKDGESESYRARQNVVFELGFFLGQLGRQRVAVIFRPHDEFEMPSDYSGVLYTPYDSNGTWKFSLAKELTEAGYSVDANAIL